MVTDFLDKLPVVGIFLASLAIAFFAINFGFRLGVRRRERLADEQTLHIGPFVTASFSLLAFMMAIVFAMIIIFLLGVILGRLSKQFWLWTGLRALTIAVLTVVIISIFKPWGKTNINSKFKKDVPTENILNWLT